MWGEGGGGGGGGGVGVWRRDGTKGAKGQTLEGIEAGNC